MLLFIIGYLFGLLNILFYLYGVKDKVKQEFRKKEEKRKEEKIMKDNSERSGGVKMKSAEVLNEEKSIYKGEIDRTRELIKEL